MSSIRRRAIMAAVISACGFGLMGCVVYYVWEWYRCERIRASLNRRTYVTQDFIIANLSADPDVVTSLRELCSCHGPRALRLHRRDVGDGHLEIVGRMSWLESLSLEGAVVTDTGLRELSHLHRLQYLSLYKCQQITDEGMLVLTSLPALQTLSVARTRVTPAGLAQFRKLRPDVNVRQSAAEENDQ